MFYSAWAIVKWFVDPVTRENVQPMMYLEGVEELIDRKWIPQCMVSIRSGSSALQVLAFVYFLL